MDEIIDPELPIIDPHHHLWDYRAVVERLPTGLHPFFDNLRRHPLYGLDEVATVGDARQLLDHIDRPPDGERTPDLVVVDIRMPPTHTTEGIEAARAIKQRHPEIGVLVLSQHIETAHAVDLVAHSGFGYLLKDRVLEVGEFLSAAERVASGGSALDPKIVATLVMPNRNGPLSRLSEREREVLALMAEGLTNSAIAQRLVVSGRTARHM